jgi:hypothetical protein
MVAAASLVESGRIPLMGAPGFRFFKDLYPDSRRGGLSYYPYSSIKAGFTPSWTLTETNSVATPGNVTIAVAPGTALIDAQDAALASSVNVVFTPEEVTNGDNFFRVFVSPTRVLQPVVANNGVFTPPTTRLNGDAVQDGDRYVECVDYPEHLEARGDGFYRREFGVWVKVDPSFERTDYPVQEGYNRTFGAKTASKLTLSNFTVNAMEAPIYINGGFPLNSYSPSRARLRNPASLEIVTAKLYYHVLPLRISATFTNGSNSVQLENPSKVVDYPGRQEQVISRALFEDLATSVANTNTLQIDGATLATGGYNATTGVITLGANYTGTSGIKQVLVTPVTSANIYVLSVQKSELMPSTNYTNP